MTGDRYDGGVLDAGEGAVVPGHRHGRPVERHGERGSGVLQGVTDPRLVFASELPRGHVAQVEGGRLSGPDREGARAQLRLRIACHHTDGHRQHRPLLAARHPDGDATGIGPGRPFAGVVGHDGAGDRAPTRGTDARGAHLRAHLERGATGHGDEGCHVERDGRELVDALGRVRTQGQAEVVVAGHPEERVGGDVGITRAPGDGEGDDPPCRRQLARDAAPLDPDVGGIAPQRHVECAHVSARPPGLACDDVDARGEIVAVLDGQHRIGDDRIVGDALAHDLDDDQPPPGVAGVGRDVVQERQGRGLLSGAEDDGGVGHGVDEALETRVLGIVAAVDERLGQIGPHTRERESALRGVDVVGERADADGAIRPRLHLHVVGEGDRTGVGLGIQNPDAHRTFARRAGGIGDAVAERHLTAVARDGGVQDRRSVGRDGCRAAIGLRDDAVEDHRVAVGVDAERVEVDRRRPAAQDTPLQRGGDRRAVGVGGENRDAHRRLVPQRRRAGAGHAVGHLVRAGRRRGEIAEHTPGCEGEAVGCRRGADAGRIERGTPTRG